MPFGSQRVSALCVSFWKGKQAFLLHTTRSASLHGGCGAIALGRPVCLWTALCYCQCEAQALPAPTLPWGLVVHRKSGTPEPLLPTVLLHSLSQSWALAPKSVQFKQYSLHNHFSACHWQIIITINSLMEACRRNWNIIHLYIISYIYCISNKVLPMVISSVLLCTIFAKLGTVTAQKRQHISSN